ncbi:aspartate/glutamate racemase family protein [Alteribacillus sp. HJP-4]|uniref:aspartate/glutamate racemase family protein n=1 Tax=Alteribacillus sp. HJP-4 TaxID=2775394 RepID=UPI0035CD0340
MKTIGLIGGMSWESSLEYYRKINELVSNRLGGLHSAKCVMYSVDFAEIEAFQRRGEWHNAAEKLVYAARKLEAAGADYLMICANTMHKIAGDVQENITIPLLHIGEAAAAEIQNQKLNKIGLLGTIYTMEDTFYKERLEKLGIEVLIPEEQERKELNRIIYEELCHGSFQKQSKQSILRMMDALMEKGAEGLVLGCTEIPLIVDAGDHQLPQFNTLDIHVRQAVEQMLT